MTLSKASILVGAVSIILSGCSALDIKHSCPLPDSCAPIHDVYEAALKDEKPDGFTVYSINKKNNVSSGSDIDSIDDDVVFGGTDIASKEKKEKKKEKKVFKHGVTPGIDAHGAVWHPPQPYWVWLAHWVDDTGVLHSGSYAWFTSKGYWTIDGVRVETSAQLDLLNEERADFEPAFIPDAPMIGPGQTDPSFSLQDAARDIKGAIQEIKTTDEQQNQGQMRQ